MTSPAEYLHSWSWDWLNRQRNDVIRAEVLAPRLWTNGQWETINVLAPEKSFGIIGVIVNVAVVVVGVIVSDGAVVNVVVVVVDGIVGVGAVDVGVIGVAGVGVFDVVIVTSKNKSDKEKNTF